MTADKDFNINPIQLKIISASSLIGAGLGITISKIFIYFNLPYLWLAFAFVFIGGFTLSQPVVRLYLVKD